MKKNQTIGDFTRLVGLAVAGAVIGGPLLLGMCRDKPQPIRGWEEFKQVAVKVEDAEELYRQTGESSALKGREDDMRALIDYSNKRRSQLIELRKEGKYNRLDGRNYKGYGEIARDYQKRLAEINKRRINEKNSIQRRRWNKAGIRT